jgi:hypothetical protein
MEQRREPRFGVDQPVAITLLRDPKVQLQATVADLSGSGLKLIANAPIAPGTAIQIEMDDSMILGEAVYCREELNLYVVGVELNQVLTGLAELGRQLQAHEFAFIS